MGNKIDAAKIAYEAYSRLQGGKNYQGNPIPAWEDVRPDIKEAWIAAITTAIRWERNGRST